MWQHRPPRECTYAADRHAARRHASLTSRNRLLKAKAGAVQIHQPAAGWVRTRSITAKTWQERSSIVLLRPIPHSCHCLRGHAHGTGPVSQASLAATGALSCCTQAYARMLLAASIFRSVLLQSVMYRGTRCTSAHAKHRRKAVEVAGLVHPSPRPGWSRSCTHRCTSP